ncbi:MAG: hypothetical protein GY863_14455, partial [bacterium]|nr:hypothetical protein [bacterium]
HVIHDSLPLISLSELALQKDPSEIKIGQIETGDSNAKEASFSISSADLRENLLNVLEGMIKESDSSAGSTFTAGTLNEGSEVNAGEEPSSIVKFNIPVSVNATDKDTLPGNTENTKDETVVLIQRDAGKVSDQLKSTPIANESNISGNKLISALQEHFAETFNTDEIIKSGKQQEDIKIGFELDLTKLSQTMKSETAEPDILEKLVNAVKAIQNSDNPDPVMQSEKVLEDIKNDIKDIKLTVTTVENKNIESRPEMQMKSIESSTVQDKKIIFSQSDNTMMIDPEKYGFQSKSMVGGSEAEIGYIKDQKPSNFNVNSIVKDQPSEPNGEKANQPVIRELDLSEKNIKVSGSKVEIIPDVVKGGSDSKTFNNIKISFDIEDVKIPENKIDKVGIPVKVETGTKVEQAVLSMSEEDFEALRISIEKETVKPAQISRDQAEIISNNPDTQKSENSFRASAKIELPVPEKDITNVEKPQVISSNKEIKIDVKPGKEESMTERPVILRIPVKSYTPVSNESVFAGEKEVKDGAGQVIENFQIKESQDGDGSNLKKPELTNNTDTKQNSGVVQNNNHSGTVVKGSDETIIADTAEKTVATKDAKNSILPGQVEITLESENNAHKTYKTQGVFVSEAPVKDVKNDKQLSSDYSSFRAGDDLNS